MISLHLLYFRSRHTGRDDRATTENVMDPRTRFILYQMLNRGLLTEMNGCVSTGKEVCYLKWNQPLGKCLPCHWRKWKGTGSENL